MNATKPTGSAPGHNSFGTSRLIWLLIAASLLVMLIGLFSTRPNKRPDAAATAAVAPDTSYPVTQAHSREATRKASPRRRSNSDDARSAEEIVAEKAAKFAGARRKLAQALAEHFKTSMPTEFERYFNAAEAGRYDDMKAIYDSLRKQREQGTATSEQGSLWRTVVETQGAADAAHDWPAQKLLNYGNAVLGSLRPGMVYVGGTDPGCFIPTMLNETSEGEHHIVLTQNALADGTYLDYLNFLYGDRMATITHDDSQRSFQEYITDAQKRLHHDQEFPNEPKQIKPGEDVKSEENRIQVSGQVAVMSINELMFQNLLAKNPDLSFAMEESFPFKSTYGSAAPLGPILELRVADAQSALTPERATQSVDYWRATAQQLLSDSETPEGSDPRKAYSKMAVAQASLLLDHNYADQAEQAYRIATEICPASPEAVFQYVNFLLGRSRNGEAVQVAQTALRAAPDNQQFQSLAKQLAASPRN